MSKQTDLINVTDAITISGSNVGIGETSPDSTLTVKGSAHTNFQVKSNSESTKAFIQTVQDSDVRIGSSTNHPVSFYQNGQERMRIDSSGNVLVGKSETAQQTAGTVLYNSGQIYNTASGTHPLVLTRKTNYGALTLFYKDTNEVGRIGTAGDDLYIGNDDTGLYFNNANNVIHSYNVTTQSGGSTNGTVDLGQDNIRFKDLYLSGGINFGGSVNSGGVTSSSNKLDDYEEGTWTPNFAGLTNSFGYYNLSGKYTKIGNIVHLQFFVQLSHNPVPTFTSQYDRIEVTGVPFPCDNGSGYQYSQGVVAAQSFLWNTYTYGSYPTTGQVGCSVDASSKMGFEVSGHGAIRSQVRNKSLMDSAAIIEASITYKTNS